MDIFHRYRQIRNLLFRKTHSTKPSRWVYIYGQSRSGTTYLYNQFLGISRGGISDWDVRSLAQACATAEESKQTHINVDRLFYDLRNNILTNAAVGSGDRFDCVVKQADGNPTEYIFWKKLFLSEPALKIFMFREPRGWWSSAVEKFGYNEEEGVEIYRSTLESYRQIGGTPLEYGEAIPNYLQQLPCIESMNQSTFSPSRQVFSQPPPILFQYYNDFKARNSSTD